MMLFNTDKMLLVNGESDICVYDDVCDDYMKSYNVMLSAIVMVKVGDYNYNTIITDSNFQNLDETTQLFLLQHEIGHAKHKHYVGVDEKQSKRIILKRCLGLLPKMEVEADCYAASVIGIANAKYSLMQLAKNKRLPLISRFELFRRYLRVKEKPLG